MADVGVDVGEVEDAGPLVYFEGWVRAEEVFWDGVATVADRDGDGFGGVGAI